ncbi:MAG: bacillithiol system redox-active protein YtxJ [Flavobacterium sp.]|nr:bacillithiol system redox-active protein YtxJ [Candidatus Neoflavobacterium equi]
MGIFNTLFGQNDGNEDANKSDFWIPLEDIKQLDAIDDASEAKTVLIFKHSTRCIVSKMALKEFNRDFDIQGDVDAYFLDLLNHRDISNAIATRYGVEHQSPQLLVLKNRQVVKHTSHSDISGNGPF